MPPRHPVLELPFGAPPPDERESAPEGADGRAPLAPLQKAKPSVISVAELDRRLKRAVEGVDEVYVEGEVEGVRDMSSGHTYFTLKDESEAASIACAMYRSAPPRARRLLVQGARIIVRGRATIWAPRGALQLIVDNAKPAGRGALLEAFERLKEKLAGEGLFARERKRPLPVGPRLIGVVTSGDGAAIHDIVKVASRRGRVSILLAKAPVQGDRAAERIARALEMLLRVPEVEAIVVTRGGGSANDLAAFNEEVLVRAIAASHIPIVSAVGHEIDVTLTDLVADARAATPSQAAELLVPDDRARITTVKDLEGRLRRALSNRLRLARAGLEQRRARLVAPDRLLASRRQLLDELEMALTTKMQQQTSERRSAVTKLEGRLGARHPSVVLSRSRGELAPLELRLETALRARLVRGRALLGASAGRLDAMSPLRVLERGYAIATDAEGRAVRDAKDVSIDDRLDVRLHRGSLVVRVERHEEPDG